MNVFLKFTDFFYSKKLSLFLSFFLIFGTTLFLYLLINIKIYETFEQGENLKIIFIHVISAWLSIYFYVLLTLLNIFGLIHKSPFLFFISEIVGFLGLFFSCITLITGCLWGLPVWGKFWVWDGRLTSMLILFCLYVIYLILIRLFKDYVYSYYFLTFFSIFGLIDIPIIKYSVDWWTTLHQVSSITPLLSHIDPVFIIFFILIAICYFSLTFLIIKNGVAIIYLNKKANNLFSYEKYRR